MKNIKFVLFLLIIFLTSLNLFSIDYGGNLDNNTSFNWGDDFTTSEKLRFSMWLGTQINPHLDFLIKGTYILSIADVDIENKGDLNRLVLNGNFPFSRLLFKFSTGRFVFSDFSNMVINHKLDGVSFLFELPVVSLKAYTGYSGLLFNHSCNINMTKSDYTDNNDEDTILAPKRLIEGAEAVFPQLFLKQSLTVSFWAQQDFRNNNFVKAGNTTEEAGTGGKLNTQYSGLGISGGAKGIFYYNTFFYVGTGKTLSYISGEYREANILSFLAGGGFRFYLENALYSRVSIDTVFSSGDNDSETYFREGNTNDLAMMFVPISTSSPALVFSPKLGNLLYIKGGYSLKPFSKLHAAVLKNFQTIVNAIVFLRPTGGQISESGLDTGSSDIYLGTEADIIINFKPFSDFGAAASVGMFFPGDVFNNMSNKFLAKIELSYAF